MQPTGQTNRINRISDLTLARTAKTFEKRKHSPLASPGVKRARTRRVELSFVVRGNRPETRSQRGPREDRGWGRDWDWDWAPHRVRRPSGTLHRTVAGPTRKSWAK